MKVRKSIKIAVFLTILFIISWFGFLNFGTLLRSVPGDNSNSYGKDFLGVYYKLYVESCSALFGPSLSLDCFFTDNLTLYIKIREADPETFKILSADGILVGVDKTNVYFPPFIKIDNGDVETLKLYDDGHAEDKNNVYTFPKNGVPTITKK